MPFLYSHWARLPITTRHLIATEFGIAKTQPTHVQDNRIVSDGYKIEDVENALNLDALQKYVGTESTDMDYLWKALVDKADGRIPLAETPSLPTVPPLVVIEGTEVIKKELIVPGEVIKIPKVRASKKKVAVKTKRK